MPCPSAGRGRRRQLRRVATVHAGPPHCRPQPRCGGAEPVAPAPALFSRSFVAAPALEGGRGPLVGIVTPGQTAGRAARQVSLASPSAPTHRDPQATAAPHLAQASR